MADVTIDVSLKEIARGYKVFEPDQVLTADQLNDLATYLDDHQRMTRVSLVGVGIFCGLRVTLARNKVVVTKGVAVTTDGDILRVPEDLEFTRFREYATAAPKYDPFFDGANRRKIFELTGKDVTGTAALDTFAGQGQRLNDWTAVLLMESYTKDGDICTGGDCDNKGKDVVSNVKLLLLQHKDAQTLRGQLETIDDAARRLKVVSAGRAKLTGAIASPAALATAYRNASVNTRAQLTAALDDVFKITSGFLGDVFAADPAPKWKQKFTEFEQQLPEASAQFYYDFLNDVVDAYTEFRDSLFGNTNVCIPALTAFSKHVVLGAVGASPLAADENRTGFYPSPLFSPGHAGLERTRFLARRLDTLINSFNRQVDAGLAITVTPSHTDARPLEARAIPAYYALKTPPEWPIHRAWSYSSERRGMAEYNYGARAAGFDAKGAAAAPLNAQISRFSLFRIEGHVGRPVTEAVQTIERLIASENLPFGVRAVLVGAETPKIVVKPPVRYSDLHRVHYLFRQNVVQHLDEVVTHTDRVSTRVGAEIDAKRLSNVPVAAGQAGIREFATEKKTAVAGSAKATAQKLSKDYVEYRKEARWHEDITTTMSNAAALKFQLGEVARTDFAIPTDTLVTNHARLVDWLDRIIEQKDTKEDERLLFSNFIKDHPGAEHVGGVTRGGTFVLLYDGDGKVVGDVSIAYDWPEKAEEPPPEPPLPGPKIKIPIFVDEGIRIRKPIDEIITDNVRIKLDDFKVREVDPVREQTRDFAKNYVAAIKESMDFVSRMIPKGGGLDIDLPGGGVTDVVKDRALDILVKDTHAKSKRVDQIRRLMVDPSVDDARRRELARQLKVAENELSAAVVETSKFVATAPAAMQDDTVAAMKVVSEGFSKLSNESATAAAERVKAHAAPATVRAETKTMIAAVLAGRGLG